MSRKLNKDTQGTNYTISLPLKETDSNSVSDSLPFLEAQISSELDVHLCKKNLLINGPLFNCISTEGRSKLARANDEEKIGDVLKTEIFPSILSFLKAQTKHFDLSTISTQLKPGSNPFLSRTVGIIDTLSKLGVEIEIVTKKVTVQPSTDNNPS